MAGLGKKTFEANAVLTAAEVNGYLMDQAVMVFASSAARSSALGTAVSEGMVTYLKDTNIVEVYTGAAWTAVGGVSSLNNTQIVNTISTSTATAYTLASSDQGKFLQFTAATAVLTVGTATAFTSGQQVQVFNDGGTALSIRPESTAVLLYGRGTAAGTAGFVASSRYDAFSIVCVGSNAYRIIGNVRAV